MPKMHKRGVEDPDPNAPEFVRDVLCHHDGIQPNSKLLQGISAAVSTALCLLSRSQTEMTTDRHICYLVRSNASIYFSQLDSNQNRSHPMQFMSQ